MKSVLSAASCPRKRASRLFTPAPWQCLPSSKALTTERSWRILHPIQIRLMEPCQKLGRPGFIASNDGLLKS